MSDSGGILMDERNGMVKRKALSGLAAIVILCGVSALLAAGDAVELDVKQTAQGWRLSLSDNSFRHVTGDAVENARLIESAGALTAAIWQERGQTGEVKNFYVLRDPDGRWTRVRETAYTLKLRAGRFDPVANVPQTIDLDTGEEANRLFIVQFHTPPRETYRQELAGLGGAVRRFLPDHAHLVDMDEAILNRVAGLSHVRWIGPYRPAYRLEEFLVENVANAEQAYPLLRYNIQVMDSSAAYKKAVADRIRALGGQVNREDAGKFLLEATLTPSQLFSVVNWNEVLFVDRWSAPEDDMDVVREIGGANFLEGVAGYTGQGVRGEVLDSGFNPGHVDFASRPLVQHTTIGNGSHGAATSGIVFGDGTGNASARGLLPDGQGIIAWSSVVFTGPSRYTHTGELLEAPYLAVFQTSSVGSARNLAYSNISSDTDSALFDFDVLHCQSQSNALERYSRPQAWAKNIVSVGGVRHFNTLDKSDDCWGCSGGGGSIGPATDGRIKPDLAHFYDNTFTVGSPGANSYTSFGGTSGATPIVAGHFGLFFQMWSEGVFGNPTPGATVFENRPHLATSKAMLINTASQYPFEGEAHDLARSHQGWGMPDVRNLYNLRDKIFIIDETDIIQPQETKVYLLDVPVGEAELKATLAFLDPPGTPGSTEARINDLSLRVASPSGDVYWGNNGLLQGVASTPGGVSNTIDTVENVIVPNPESGVWTVEVIADEINQDGHVETPALDADFALVVSGVSGEAAQPPLQILFAQDAPATIEPDTAFEVRIRVLDGSQSLSGAPLLHYRFANIDTFTTEPMTDQGGGVFSGTVMGASCGTRPEFYFSASANGGGDAFFPLNAPNSVFLVNVVSKNILVKHDFESGDQGWTAGAPDDDATTGAWERAEPLARSIQPLFDHTPDPGVFAFVTQNEVDNQGVGANDVDNGKTTLFSPIFDLSGDANARIGYRRWYANYLATQDDVFTVDISSDGGANWVNVETIGPTGAGTNGGWVYHEFAVSDVTTPTSQVQLRFIASDNGEGSLVEAGLDDFEIFLNGCDCSEALYFGQLAQWPQVNVLDLLNTISSCNLILNP